MEQISTTSRQSEGIIKLLTQKAFGELAGVKQSSISYAIKNGMVVKTGKRIDPQHPINQAYIANSRNYNSGNKTEQKWTASLNKSTAPRAENSDFADLGVSKEFQDATAAKRRQEAEIGEIKTLKERVILAKELKKLIPIEYFQTFCRAIFGALTAYVLPIDERIADQIVAECGVTDPLVVNRVRKIIRSEIKNALSSVKKKAEVVPVDLGLLD